VAILYAVKAHIKNEVTGEPHIHFYTFDYDQAQAFAYSITELLGATCEIRTPLEATPLCRACEEAREKYGIYEYVWDPDSGWSRSERRKMPAMRPPDV